MVKERSDAGASSSGKRPASEVEFVRSSKQPGGDTELSRIMISARRTAARGGAGIPGPAPRGNRREWSPLELEEVEFVPGSSAKQKAGASEERAAKVAKVAQRTVLQTSAERTGGKSGRNIKLGLNLRMPILEGVDAGTGFGMDTAGKGKAAAFTKGGGKKQNTIVSGDELDRRLVYIDERSGDECSVKKMDCSFKVAPIASCVLDVSVLDGDRREMDTKSLRQNLRAMDLAQCLLLTGYQKLKQIAQIAELESGELEKVKDELANLRAVQEMEKREAEERQKKSNDEALERMTLASANAKLKEELAAVTEYAKKCKAVAKEAQDAYNALDKYEDLETTYLLLKWNRERGALGTPEEKVPGNAGDVPSTSIVVPGYMYQSQ